MHVIVRVQLGEVMLRNSEIEQLEVKQVLGEHTRLRLAFMRDRETDVQLETLLGADALVTLQVDGDDEGDLPEVEIFRGVVSAGSQSHYMHFGSSFSIDAVSPSIRLEYRNSAYFPKSTLADVARKLAVDLADVPRANTPLDLVQIGESDFDFLRRLADEGGLFLRTTGAKPELRGSFEDRGTELHWGDDLIRITARAQSVNHGFKGAYYAFEEKRDHRFHGVRKDPTRFGAAPQLASSVHGLAAKTWDGGDSFLEDSPYRASTLAEFKDSLERESERALGCAIVLVGETTNIHVRAGDTTTIVASGTFKPPAVGVVGLVEVTHRFDGQSYSNGFTATTWTNYTNSTRPHRHLAPGPVTAEVVGINDPQKMGRIRVRYRWHELDQETRWLRVLTPYSGNGRGILFTPEVGDEVVIAFEQGDPERPFVLGALWNGKDLAPQDVGAKRIITRSGNTIQLLDDPSGKEMIEIFSAQGKCLVQMANDAGGGPLLTIHSEGDLAIEATGEIRMTSGTFVQIVKGDSQADVGGDATHEAKGNFVAKSGKGLTMQAGMNATLKGGMNVQSVAGMVNNVVGKLVHIQPPGFAAPRTTVVKPPAKKSVWTKKAVPKAVKGKSTSDTRTPRTS